MMKTILSTSFFILTVMLFFPVSTHAFNLDDINVHGFISQGYLRTTDNNFMAETRDGTLEFNEIGINFSTDLSNRLHAGVQFFAYDLGDEGNDKIGIDWGFADYHWRRELGLRIGKMKLVSGLYGERRQLDMLRTGIFLPFGVYLGPWWESIGSFKGITLYGELPAGNFGDIGYNIQAGSGHFTEDTGLARALENTLSMLNLHITDMDSDYLYSASLEWVLPFHDIKTHATFFSINSATFQGDISMPVPPGNRL
jgi:hypothetical protein